MGYVLVMVIWMTQSTFEEHPTDLFPDLASCQVVLARELPIWADYSEVELFCEPAKYYHMGND